ncbi:hypothetical protein [Bifidobacterium simiarum]|uniref:Uncharacterized protein n=1 Tax=Bifidobacterium simiarum TaxID=2045441 RepID=A0A2M9HE06_9BIFI|nr:hypothetical protein [Bifidobacterium simiarum]MBT1166724.1 hypothetical protein [Bifidobacterium simiarum]PJM75035.1 hypothetical protein CSQ87_07375 [Bifidobacterium simiarum]
MDDEALFNSLITLLRQHGLESVANDAVDCWNHGEEDAGIGFCASVLLERGIKPNQDVLRAYGLFARDSADDGLGFDDTDLNVYEGLKNL